MPTRYRNRASKLAGATGTATFELPAPPMGVVLTGAIGIPSAPTGALATVTIGGITWGTWAGNATFGPIQQFASETVSVAVTGLTPGASYDLAFIGQAEDEEQAQIIWPSALATALSTTSVTVPAFHGARVFRVAVQSIPSAAFTAVTWTDEEYDTNAIHDPGTPTVMTVPVGFAGYWMATAAIAWQSTAGGQRQVFYQKNGVTLADGSVLQGVALGNIYQPAASPVLALAAGDTLSVIVYQDTGGPLNITTDSRFDFAYLGT